MPSRKVVNLERLLLLATAELDSARRSYHHYIPEQLVVLLRSALGARPRRLRRLLARIEAIVADRGLPPRFSNRI